ncbi:hypothetical protein V8245_13885 [Flavobacterium columnare]|uniref:Uncharacterized protein n=1 Tax=Flavobacterium columnare TaxID=996 RepID=A0AAI8CFB2_9FLAO|nr:hypothetical protein [Flavobacterium columnare]AMO19110.1 hypothetical protein UN65_00955 [Flavobacterium columnare]MEB3799881.1 hypothetical protein [Flavobacterium columnare]OOB82511.1 hypothetical protein BZL53_09150 [Flavobacterium columnare]QOG56052.1 hypothetical protein HUE29_00975 [Flavobacterium columnare]QOG58774.1 hypothetical protein HUE30_00975 [Flavobacterium columnare]
MRIVIIIVSFLNITICKSQEKENPKYLEKKDSTFYIDKITFKENKDTLFSKITHVLGNINDKVYLYNIDSPENISTNIGNTNIKFDYMQFWIKKNTNNLFFLELEAYSDDKKNQNIINSFDKRFKKIDLTDKKKLKKDIEDINTFMYYKNYLFKSVDIYFYLETITFKKKKEKNRIRLYVYKYPFDSILIELNQINDKIINQ